MNKESIQEIVNSHFSSGSYEPLIRAFYAKITNENMFEFFAVDNLFVKKAVARRINKQMKNPGFLGRVIKGLEAEPEVRQGILTALSYVNVPIDNILLKGQVIKNLQHEEYKVREAAARAIAYKYPKHAIEILPLLKEEQDKTNRLELTKIMCCSNNQSLIFPLLDFYGFPEKEGLTSAIGFLLSPVWLGGNYPIRPGDVSALISKCGYSDCKADRKILDLLKQDFMFVSEEMAKSPKVKEWVERIKEFSWQLLPDGSGMQRPTSVNLEDKIDVALFLAAARESDLSNLYVKREQNPFDYRTIESLDVVVVSHAPYRYVEGRIINEGIKLGEKLSVAKKDMGAFLVDHARVVLETDHERYTEAYTVLCAKWLALSKVSKGSYALYPKSWPIRKDEDFPLAKLGVIKEFTLPEQDKRLSVGARGTVNLAHYLGIKGLEDALAELEGLYSKFLLPVGCELQFGSGMNVALAWKQALRYFNIGSPRRPRFSGLVEVAFRPAKTYHSHILGTMFLHKMGLFNIEQDIAFHISVQGDLGDDARYVLFPHLFTNLPRERIKEKELRFRKIARLMSKGYVHLNNDVEPCHPDGDKPEYRTEIRTYCCPTDKINNKVKLRLTFIDDLVSTHLLSSALKSELPEFQRIWQAYKKEVESYAKSVLPGLDGLLHSDWYQSTGDPKDGKLVGLLPIIQKKEEVASIIAEKGLAAELEMNFHGILSKYSKEVHEMFVNLFGGKYDFSSFPVCGYGVPYFVPKELVGSLSENHFSSNFP